MKEKIIHPTKKFLIILLIINIVCVLVVSWIRFVDKNNALLLYSEQAAERWKSEEMKYSLDSVFYSPKSAITSSEVSGIRNQIQKKLIEDSYIDWTSEGESWIDCYSGRYFEEVRYNDTKINVNVYAVGGHFFDIHPIPIVSGNYLDMDSDDVNQIVLDEYVAWNLFGSSDIIGKKMWIGESIFTVTGVVKVGEDDPDIQAYGEYNAVYVPIPAYSNIRRAMSNSEAEGESTNKDTTLYVDCYEALIPSPVKNYGFNVFSEAVGVEVKSDEEKEKMRSTLNFDDKVVVENSTRFNIGSLVSRQKERKYIDMSVNSVIFPYWENVARYEEKRQIGHLIICVIFLVIPLLTIIYLIYIALHYLNEFFDKLTIKLES